MKKYVKFLLPILSVIFLVGCSQTKTKSDESKLKETDTDSALMYTFKLDEHEYRFRLLDGWIKFPNEDKTIAFLVANKDTKSYMSAGFEPKKQPLDKYKDSFVEKVGEKSGNIIKQPEKKTINNLDSYYLTFNMKDNKDRDLTYKTYLIETDDYFINLAAWTSDEKPTDKVLNDLDKMLATFEQLK